MRRAPWEAASEPGPASNRGHLPAAPNSIEAVARFEKEFEGMNPARPRYWSGIPHHPD